MKELRSVPHFLLRFKGVVVQRKGRARDSGNERIVYVHATRPSVIDYTLMQLSIHTDIIISDTMINPTKHAARFGGPHAGRHRVARRARQHVPRDSLVSLSDAGRPD